MHTIVSLYKAWLKEIFSLSEEKFDYKNCLNLTTFDDTDRLIQNILKYLVIIGGQNIMETHSEFKIKPV